MGELHGQYDSVLNNEVTSRRHISRRWFLIAPLIVILIAGLGAGAWVLYVKQKPPSKEQIIATGKTANQQQLDDLVARFNDPSLSIKDKSGIYMQAAILAAGLNQSQAKDYAIQALALRAKYIDPNSQPIGNPALERVQKIAKGDYSVQK